MLPLKILQKTHPSATYLIKDGKAIKDIVIANRKKTDLEWFDYSLKDKYGLEFIPAEIVAEVNELARPSIRYNQRSDARSIAIAKEKVFPAFVESVIEALPIFYDEDTRKVTFMDFLVVCPLNPIFSDLKVYVPSVKAGMLRLPRTNLKNMVGRYVSCKIENLQLCKLPNPYETKGIWNNYYAEGSIDYAEWLANNDIKKALTEEPKKGASRAIVERIEREKNEWLERTYQGLIAQSSERGIHVICNDFGYFTVYIPRKRISHTYDSVVPSCALKFKVGEKIEFKILAEQIYKPGIENQIVADAKCLEVSPREKVVQLIDENRLVGTTHKAYVVDYNITKGHRIELEDIAGVTVKLDGRAPISPDFVIKKTPIYVKVERARRTLKSSSDDLRFSVHCTFISDAGTRDKAANLFKF